MSVDPIDYLRELAVELETRRFAVRLCVQDGSTPALTVVNTEAPVLTESILAVPDVDGRLWFSFFWKRITPVTDLVAAADRIERVLAEVGR
ncbi:hypothetical protein [Planotetraspora sp. GP83]|uniref:hypothetical protein n=1 Tax=Planotetraspora sp. GP83 TaxID=3156264 RepID=UPI003510F727